MATIFKELSEQGRIAATLGDAEPLGNADTVGKGCEALGWPLGRTDQYPAAASTSSIATMIARRSQ